MKMQGRHKKLFLGSLLASRAIKKVSYFEIGFDPIVTRDPKVSAIQYAHSFTDKAGM